MDDADFKIANIVTVAYLDQELNLAMIYDLLTIIPFDYKIGTKVPGMGRETVPFFGINNVIVGLRYGTQMRGIERTNGHLQSLIGVDIQCCNKNINLKVSRNKIQLTGSKSEAMAIEATTLLLKHLEMMIGHFNHVKSLSRDIQRTSLEWLMVTLIDTTRSCMKGYDETLESFSSLKESADVDKHMAIWLSMFACEYKKDGQASVFVDKIFRIMSYICSEECPFIKVPEMISYKICNGVYNFCLGKKISLIETSQGMIRLGYKVSYHNWSAGKKIKIAIPILEESTEAISPLEEDSEEEEVSTPLEAKEDPIFLDKKLRAHRFTVNQSGNVRYFTNVSFHKAYEQFLAIREDLLTI